MKLPRNKRPSEDARAVAPDCSIGADKCSDGTVASGGVRGNFLTIDKSAVPELKDYQRKYFGGTGIRFRILFNKLLDRLFSKIATRNRFRIQQNIGNQILKVMPQPTYRRIGKADLAAV